MPSRFSCGLLVTGRLGLSEVLVSASGWVAQELASRSVTEVRASRLKRFFGGSGLKSLPSDVSPAVGRLGREEERSESPEEEGRGFWTESATLEDLVDGRVNCE